MLKIILQLFERILNFLSLIKHLKPLNFMIICLTNGVRKANYMKVNIRI